MDAVERAAALRAHAEDTANCTRCALAQGRTQVVFGSGSPNADLMDVELWRGGTRLGLLARRRELLPGRYTFGLTGRGPTGERLARGKYTIRLLAFPGDGTRKQADTIEYRVR